MKNISITSTFAVYDSVDELPDDVKVLMERAVTVRNTSYAPYSQFHVGAALLLDNGEIVVGSNQENAAYPSGLCAERVAIFYAGSVYPNAKILKMVITASSEEKTVEDPIPPCGACRQVMAEYQQNQEENIRILLHSPNNDVLIAHKVEDLLPFMFTSPLLKKH